MNGSYTKNEFNPIEALLERTCPKTENARRFVAGGVAENAGRVLALLATCFAGVFAFLSCASVRKVVRAFVLVFCFLAAFGIAGGVEQEILSLKTGLLCGGALAVLEFICIR